MIGQTAAAAAPRASLANGRWIFLRGLAREAAHWGSFLDAWRDHLPATEVVTADLPGCGVRHRDKSPWTVPAIVEMMRETTGFAGASAARTPAARRPAAIFAMSLGAMVAYEWLRRYPREVDGLVLVNGSIGAVSPIWRRLRWFGIRSMVRATVARRLEGREEHILGMVSSQVGTRRRRADLSAEARRLVVEWAEIARARPVTRSNAFRQVVAAARFRPAFPPLVDHALVLASLGDRMVDPVCSRQLAAGIGAQLREHPTAGHDLPLDAPEWVAAEVAAWTRARTDEAVASDGARGGV